MSEASSIKAPFELRQYNPENAENFFSSLDKSRPVLGVLGVTDTIPNLEMVKDLFDKKYPDTPGYGVWTEKDGERVIAGNISFDERANNLWEIGYWKAEGFDDISMTDAVEQGIAKFREGFPDVNLVAYVQASNEKSQLLLARLGYVPETYNNHEPIIHRRESTDSEGYIYILFNGTEELDWSKLD